MAPNWLFTWRTFAALSLFILLGGCAQLSSQSPETVDRLSDIQAVQAQSLQDQQALLEQQSEQMTLLQKQLVLLSKQQSDQQQQLQQVLKAQQAPAPAAFKPATRVAPGSCNINGKMLLGAAEWVWLKPVGKAMRARIDTGAATSSLSTANVEVFERDGQDWVRFQLIEEGQAGIQVEARLLRKVRIRQASMEEGERRYVVRLPVQLGELIEEAEFTLADRSNMRYPVLLGREFLRDVALVDVAKKYIQAKPEPAPEVGLLLGRHSE